VSRSFPLRPADAGPEGAPRTPALLCLDRDLRVVSASEELAALAGARPAAGAPLDAALPALAPALAPLARRALAEAAPLLNIPLPAGPGAGLVASFLPVQNRAGHVLGLDVTVSRQSGGGPPPEPAPLSEVAAAFDTMPVGLVLLDGRELRVRWANATYLSFLEAPFDRGPLTGRWLHEFIPRAEESGVAAIFRQVAASGEPYVNPEYRHEGFARGATYWRWSLLPVAGPAAPFDLLLVVTEVTEQVLLRQEAEKLAAALRQEQIQLATILEQLPVGLVIAEAPGGRIVRQNAATQRLLGSVPPDISGTADYSQYGASRPDGRAYAPEEYPLARALRGEAVQAERMRYPRPDGSVGELEVSAAPVCDADGRIMLAVVVFQDVGERERLYRAERQARERAERLQAVTAALSGASTPADVYAAVLHRGLGVDAGAPEGLGAQAVTLYIRDGDTLTLAGSAGFSEELVAQYRHIPLDAPIPAADAVRLGRPVWLRTQDDYVRAYPHLEAAIRNLGAETIVSLPVLVEGRVLGGLNFTFAQALALDAGERGFLQALADQTAQALERSRLFAALTISERRFRALSDAGILGVLFSDPRGRIVDANAAFLAMLGLGPEALAGGLTWQALTPPEWAERDAEADRLLKAQGFVPAYEKEFFRRDGGRVPVLIGAALVGDGGEIGVGFVLDISERRHAEQALLAAMEREQALRRQAEEASRLKDEFLATVSHELRTPLTAFLGYAELLQRRRHDEAYVARTAEKMVRSARAQAELIEDLLDVSRVVSGKLRIAPEPLALAPVVAAALDTVRPAAEAKGIQLSVDLDPAAGTVLGDGGRLQQVVWNLLSNAAKFTPAGGAITVRLRRDDAYAELSVRDTGQGIAPDFLPSVFDRFRQADSSSHRTQGGLGLGLAIVRHVVELHGGAVAAASDGLGKGATFTVRLPLLAGQQAAAVAEAGAAPPGLTDGRQLAGRRVVVVDDQPEILDLLGELLALAGAEVRACGTAREALALVRGWRPDALVSDIAMPAEDGYWLIGRVRGLPPEQGGATPALALTAYVRMEDRLRVLAAGFQLYIPKPIDPDEFLAVVAQLTGREVAE
jgi:PAS domain S-box-containing protein